MDIEPPLKKKSDNNLLAAQLLIKGENCTLNENKINLANESVHCSYYAVVQYCKYFLMERKNIDEQQLNAILKGAGSHQKICAETADELRLDDKDLVTSFIPKFVKLQEAREIADYEEYYISPKDAIEHLSSAIHIINKLLFPKLKPKKK